MTPIGRPVTADVASTYVQRPVMVVVVQIEPLAGVDQLATPCTRACSRGNQTRELFAQAAVMCAVTAINGTGHYRLIARTSWLKGASPRAAAGPTPELVGGAVKGSGVATAVGEPAVC